MLTHSTSNSIAKSHGELHLLRAVKHLLPKDTEIIQNYRHSNMIHSVSGFAMELDVYCPSLKLAFEYQGGAHYHGFYKAASLKSQHRRDEEKRAACEKLNITLIPIPYWWDRTPATLAATIRHYRPDITLSSSIVPSERIPDLPPERQKEQQMVDQNPASLFVRVHKLREFMNPTDG